MLQDPVSHLNNSIPHQDFHGKHIQMALEWTKETMALKHKVAKQEEIFGDLMKQQTAYVNQLKNLRSELKEAEEKGSMA